MKTLIKTITLVLFLAFTTMAFAQEHKKKDHPKRTPQEKAEQLTRKMDESLNLSDEQTAKVMKVNMQLMEEVAKYKTEDGKKSPEAKARIKDAKSVAQQQLQSVLSPEQFKKFQQMEAEKKAKKHDQKSHDKSGKTSPSASPAK
jgi:protein CpxP